MKPHIQQFATETFGCVIRKVSSLPVLRDREYDMQHVYHLLAPPPLTLPPSVHSQVPGQDYFFHVVFASMASAPGVTCCVWVCVCVCVCVCVYVCL